MTEADKLEKLTQSINELCAIVRKLAECVRQLADARDDHAGAIEQLMAGHSAIAASVGAIRDKYAAIMQAHRRRDVLGRLDVLEADKIDGPARELIYPLN
jgi:hypothetical protein